MKIGRWNWSINKFPQSHGVGEGGWREIQILERYRCQILDHLSRHAFNPEWNPWRRLPSKSVIGQMCACGCIGCVCVTKSSLSLSSLSHPTHVHGPFCRPWIPELCGLRIHKSLGPLFIISAIPRCPSFHSNRVKQFKMSTLISFAKLDSPLPNCRKRANPWLTVLSIRMISLSNL